MAGDNRSKAGFIAFLISLAMHLSALYCGWILYMQTRPITVEMDAVMEWEWLEYVPEEVSALPSAAEVPPPLLLAVQSEPEPEPEAEVVASSSPVAPLEVKKKEPPRPKEKLKPKKEVVKKKPSKGKEKTKPKPRELPPEAQPHVPLDFKPPRASRPAMSEAATAGTGQMINGAGRNPQTGGGKQDGGQRGSDKVTAANYNNGLQGTLARAVQKRKGRIRERGTTVVSFDIQANGQFSNIRIVRSSGVARIDNLMLDAVRGVGRYAPPPEGQTISRTIPLIVN